MRGVQPRFRVWWQLSEPGIPGLGVQKCSWQGFRKQKVRWGVRSVTELGGKGPFVFVALSPALWALTAAEGAEQARWLGVGTLVKSPGRGGQGHEVLQAKLQRRQWRRGPRRPERRALTPEPAPFFRVRSLWETQDPPRPRLFPSPWAGAGFCPRPLQGRRLCGQDC